MAVEIPKNYCPSENEEYMNPMQLEYFQRQLNAWRDELLEESEQTINTLQEENWNESDMNDRATLEEEAALELRTRDRYRKLIRKIDLALIQIKNGSYGYCEKTGEEIGIRRLHARPIATMTLEAQEKHERHEH